MYTNIFLEANQKKKKKFWMRPWLDPLVRKGDEVVKYKFWDFILRKHTC